MSGMPYHLTKGPFFAAIEAAVLKMSVEEMVDWRTFLEDGGAIPEMAPAQGYDAAVPGAKEHLYRDWLGFEQDPATGEWARPDPLPETVGWWSGWRGDADTIIRRTLVEAIEAAVGWQHGQGPTRPEPWPIDFIWSCPHPWIEGWIIWAPTDGGDLTAGGRVTVFFATPGNGEGVHQDDVGRPTEGVPGEQPVPIPTGTRIPSRPVGDLPASKSDKAWGMHVVRARRHHRTGLSTSVATPFGKLKISLGAVVVDDEEAGIWVHSPSPADGGLSSTHV